MASQDQIAARVDFACGLIETGIPHFVVVTQLMGKFKVSRAVAYRDVGAAETALKGTDDGAPTPEYGDYDVESHIRLALHYAYECQAVGDALGASRQYASAAKLMQLSGRGGPDR